MRSSVDGSSERAVVGEGDVVQVEPVVVGVERRPAAVEALHAEHPAEPALLRRPHAVLVEARDSLERHEDDGAVVDVDVVRVVVLERPAAGLHVRPLHLPVAGGEHLAVDHPLGGLLQRGMVGRHPAFHERVDHETRVPDRGHAGLAAQLVRVLDDQRFDLLDLPEDQRMVVGVPEGAEREDRVRHRRIDAAEPAGRRQPLVEPAARGFERHLAQRPRREALPDLEPVVDGDEEALPEEAAPAERLRHAREAEARVLARDRPQLVERLLFRQPLDRLAIHEDRAAGR